MSKEKNISPAEKPKKINNAEPGFEPGKAKGVKPYRDERTARTVGYEQPGKDGETLLFSATGAFIRSKAAKKA